MSSTSLRVAYIDRDYIFDKENFLSRRIGTEWTVDQVMDYYSRQNMGEQLQPDWAPDTTEKVRFRLLDDDREVYYGGWLLNDDECLVQMMVSAWGAWDAGAIHIEIKRGEEWVMEIA